MAVSMSLRYDGELRCTLVHEPSSEVMRTDAPTDNRGRGESFSPTDLVGAALMSCAVTTMAIKAPQEGIAFTSATAHIAKEMTSAPPRKIARLTLTIELPKTLEAHHARLEEIARNCPVALSIGRDVEVETRFVYDSTTAASS